VIDPKEIPGTEYMGSTDSRDGHGHGHRAACAHAAVWNREAGSVGASDTGAMPRLVFRRNIPSKETGEKHCMRIVR